MYHNSYTTKSGSLYSATCNHAKCTKPPLKGTKYCKECICINYDKGCTKLSLKTHHLYNKKYIHCKSCHSKCQFESCKELTIINKPGCGSHNCKSKGCDKVVVDYPSNGAIYDYCNEHTCAYKPKKYYHCYKEIVANGICARHTCDSDDCHNMVEEDDYGMAKQCYEHKKSDYNAIETAMSQMTTVS